MKRRNFIQGLFGAAAGLLGSVAAAAPPPLKKYNDLVILDQRPWRKRKTTQLTATPVDGGSFSLVGSEESIFSASKYDNTFISPRGRRPRFVKTDQEKQAFGVIEISAKEEG